MSLEANFWWLHPSLVPACKLCFLANMMWTALHFTLPLPQTLQCLSSGGGLYPCTPAVPLLPWWPAPAHSMTQEKLFHLSWSCRTFCHNNENTTEIGTKFTGSKVSAQNWSYQHSHHALRKISKVFPFLRSYWLLVVTRRGRIVFFSSASTGKLAMLQ